MTVPWTAVGAASGAVIGCGVGLTAGGSGVRSARRWLGGVVDVGTVAWLASGDGALVLRALTAYDDAAHERAAAGDAGAVDPLRAASAARAAHPQLDPALVSAALTQVRLRRRARPRLGDLADHVLLTEQGLEQATRTVVAELRAQRYADAGASHVADLGCGLGLDTVAFARLGLRVTAVERDPVTAALAAANVAALGLADRVDVVLGDVTDAEVLDRAVERADAAYLDPARRDLEGGKADRRARRGADAAGAARRSDPADWSPPWSWVQHVAGRVPRTAAKVAPGVPHELTPPGGCATWTSVDGQLVEAELAWPGLAPPRTRRRALVVRDGQVTSVSADDDLAGSVLPDVGAVGAWLLEPDDAIIRAGLVAAVADQVGGRLLDPRVAYVTTDADVDPGALAARFRVRHALPYSLDALRATLVADGVGHVVVKKRAIAADPDDVRRRLALPAAPGTATVLLTRVGEQPWAYVGDAVARVR